MILKEALQICSYPLWVNNSRFDSADRYTSKDEAMESEKYQLSCIVNYITSDAENEITIEIQKGRLNYD